VLAARDGSVWIGAHGGLTRWKDERATVFSGASGLPGAPQSLYEDHHGRVWVFTEHGLAFYRDGRFVAVDAVPGGRVHSMAGDEAGHVWLSEDRGLLHLRDGRLIERIPWPAMGRRQQANVALAGLEPGSVWLGFWRTGGGGLSYFRDGQVRAAYGVAEGLGPSHVSDLRFDEDGALWAAIHEAGVSRIKDGRITTLASGNGLPCDTVHWTMEDGERALWLYAACGLVRIARAERDAWVADSTRRIKATVWAAADGVRLRSLAASEFGPRVAKAEDGRLWFVTGEGIQVVDPRRVLTNPLPPPVHVEQVTADRKAYDPSVVAIGRLRLPPQVRDLEIGYTALSLVAPEKVLFRYKLEGRDRAWQEAGTRRWAFYNDLPPGDYRFRVIACNNSGVWNEEGAALEFTILPAWHQTIAFRALAASALATLLWSAYRLRVRVLERHAAEAGAFNERLMKAQEQERTRIAGDLHDSVMQQIAALSLVLGTAKRKMPADSEARDMVVEVQRKLIDVGNEVRQLSHDLYPPMLKEAGLAEVLRGYCDAFGRSRGIPIACEVDDSVAELSPGTALALYRIGQEALGNAAKHAAPTRVEVRLLRIGGDVVLTVADDGRGFEPGRGEGRGLGLVNMRERARQLGGTFELDSQPGRGTTVRVALPFRSREAKQPEPAEARK
jgi:signal transduction histidine kinase